MNFRICALTAAGLTLFMGRQAQASFHLWQIQEVFSNASGTIQFVELHEQFDGEEFINNTSLRSASTGKFFHFPDPLPTEFTADKHLLLGTSGFAALAGAPALDYLIENNFFNTSADTLSLDFTIGTPFTFTAGQLPLNGTSSLNYDSGTGQYSNSLNSPTNFAGDSAPVTVPVPEPATLALLSTAGLLLWRRRRA